MPLKLQVGKRYRDQNGDLVTITEKHATNMYKSTRYTATDAFVGTGGARWDSIDYLDNGVCPYLEDQGYNLIAEDVIEPPMPVTYAVKEPESIALVPDPACPRAEVDPTGKSAKEPGSKLDADRVDVTLLTQFPRALEEVARVGDYGQNKYTRGGWLTVPDGIRRYTRAMMAHLFKEQTEGTYDQDPHPQMQEPRWKNKIRHDAQVAWNALARLELTLREGK